MLATLRSDFLNELFQHKGLWDIAKLGVELRVMNREELQEAIQQPLFAACRGSAPGEQPDERYCHKRFDPALLETLAQDAGQEAAFLPLLQLTLQVLWSKGSLKRSQYSDLSDAIQRRAELVFQYEDFGASLPRRNARQGTRRPSWRFSWTWWTCLWTTTPGGMCAAAGPSSTWSAHLPSAKTWSTI